MLIIPELQILESPHIVELLQLAIEALNDIGHERLDVLGANEIKQLNDSRVENVVAGSVCLERLDHGREQIRLDYVLVVDLLLQAQSLAQEPERRQGQELVLRLEQDQDALEQVLVHDVVLDVVGVAFDAERQEVQDQVL